MEHAAGDGATGLRLWHAAGYAPGALRWVLRPVADSSAPVGRVFGLLVSTGGGHLILAKVQGLGKLAENTIPLWERHGGLCL